MSNTDIQALTELQGSPVLIDPDGIVVLDDLSTWATPAERGVHRRARINAIAFAGMSPEELHLFFAHTSQAVVKSWNAKQSFFGKIQNMVTTRNPGYVEVPGRILSQCLKVLGEAAA
ncbi:MAG: hypothetical protein P1U83_04515 [Roseovarius sp.]|nr:hypothetical protein [Roseovarius sp.]